MAKKLRRGDAQPRPQVDDFLPANPEPGDLFTLTCNRKDLTYTAVLGNTAQSVIDYFVGVIGEYGSSSTEDLPEEFKKLKSASATNAGGSAVLRLTGPTDGEPFTVTSATTNAGGYKVTVTTLINGAANVNEKQLIKFRGVPTGGTFTLTYAGQTTAAIAFNANAAAVDAALEALSNIGAGDVTVTGDATNGWTVEFTGALAGVDVPLITGNGSALTGGQTVTVVTTINGAASTNEVQRVTRQSSNHLFSWRVVWVRPDGSTLSSNYFPWSASAATVQTELNRLAQDVNGFTVTKTASGANDQWNITFQNQYGGQNVNQLAVEQNVAAPVLYTAETITEGSAVGTNEVQKATINGLPTGGTFTLTFEGQTTAAIAWNASNYDVWNALCDLSNIGGTNEVQTITITGGPTGGSFTLTYAGQTTAAIAWNANAAAVQAALEALSNIGVGNVTCGGGALPGTPVTVTFKNALGRQDVALMTATNSLTGGAGPAVAVATTTAGVIAEVSVTGSNGGPYTITFQNALGSSDREQMGGSGALLTGMGVDVTTTQNASTGNNEQQSVELESGVSGGTFTLTWNPGGGNETTAAIAFNATAAAVQAALEALATPVPGDFLVIGPDGGPWIVEFKGAFVKINVNAMTGSGTNLTGTGTQSFVRSVVTAPTGPNHWWEAENFSDGALPVNGDTVVVSDQAVDILYTLEGGAGVLLAELRFELTFTGRCGLDPFNALGYWEYLPIYLKQPATKLVVDCLSPFMRIDTVDDPTEVWVWNTGQSDTTTRAFIWKGNDVLNVVRVFRGDVGIANAYDTDVAVLATLQVGFDEVQDTDVTVECGTGLAAIPTLLQTGGQLFHHADIVTGQHRGGSAEYLDGSSIQTIINTGCQIAVKTQGAIGSTLAVGSGPNARFDFSRAPAQVAVTEMQLYNGAGLNDPYVKITQGAGKLKLIHCGLNELSEIDLGTNIQITVTAL